MKKCARQLMLDREAWRRKIKMRIVAKNKELDSSKREESKIRCGRTGSATVLMELRGILSRLVVVVSS
jgi:hypothetical protein